MIQGLLMLSGIVFPFLYFFQKKELDKLKYNQKEFKEQVLKEAKKFTTPKITADFEIQRSNNKSTSIYDPLLVEYYRDKKIKREYLYPIKGLEDTGNYFFGKKVVITGDFEKFQDRNEMAKLLWEAGADIDTNVGKYTDCLIVGSNAGDVKIEYSEENGIEILFEENFLEQFNID